MLGSWIILYLLWNVIGESQAASVLRTKTKESQVHQLQALDCRNPKTVRSGLLKTICSTEEVDEADKEEQVLIL